jgi:hypothetical protein
VDQHCYPFKIQTVQEVNKRDKQCRIHVQFGNQILDVVRQRPGIVNALQMSDEAYFHLSGYVKTQNVQYWAPHSPHDLHQRTLHSLKVTAWCTVRSCGIIGPSLRTVQNLL